MKQYSLRSKILYIVLGFTIFSQFIYLYINVRSFQQRYYAVIQSNLSIVGHTLKDNLDFILKKRIPINRLFGLEALLKGSLSDSPYLKYVAIKDADGKYLYYCDRKTFVDPKTVDTPTSPTNQLVTSKKYTLDFDLTGLEDKHAGEISLIMDQEMISKKVNQIALDTGTTILIAILSIFDFLFFIVAYTISLPIKIVSREIELDLIDGRLDRPVERTGIDYLDMMIHYFDRYRYQLKEKWIKLETALQSLAKNLNRPQIETQVNISALQQYYDKIETLVHRFAVRGKNRILDISNADPVLIRPAIFLFVFAESLSISFLPLYAEELYQPLFNLSKEVVLGLPISAFMLFTAISLPLGGAWSDIFGRKRTFLCGALISCIGLTLTATAQTIPMLVVYRAIVGTGFGIVFMTAQGYIIDTTQADNRAEGIAIFLSAFYGGTLCGSAIGGMIADRVGFRLLFYAGAALAMISVIFLYLFISPTNIATPSGRIKRSAHDNFKKLLAALPSIKDTFRLLADRNFLAVCLFQSIPNKICLIGFVYYSAPLFLRELGNSQSDTGRYIMGYSLVMIVLSQSLSKWSDQFKDIKQLIFIGGSLSGLILVPFFFAPNTITIALGILALGAIHALSVPNQAKLASQLNVVQKVGVGSGLGIYRQVERIGNVIAPILIGVLASMFGYAKSLAIIGLYTAISSLLFLLMFKDENSSESEHFAPKPEDFRTENT